MSKEFWKRKGWAGVLGLGMSLVLAGCGNADSALTPAEQVVSVRAAAVIETDAISEPLRFSGIVQARQRATLTFQVSGNLRERLVELGQDIEQGQELARLFNPALEPARDSAQARLDELRTQLQQAQREWERAQRLHERGVVSEQALEQLAARRDGLRASVATARAALAEAEQMVAEGVLKAPFAGRIEAVFVEQGEFVAAGQPVMRLSSPSGREVEIRMPAYLLSQLQRGQTVPVWSVQDRRLAPVTGTVVEIAQAGSARGELHPVLVSLPQQGPGPGVPVEVGVTITSTQDLLLPMLSVMRSPTGTSVYRVMDGRAERIPVQVQRVVGEQVMVVSESLAAGDQVIYAGLTRLADGDRVEVRP
ncbi:MAG: efflux RND transporter periplasmic adaptor subunit [Marinobacter sp.]|nr:efflux RND transporter periplasmic adaptor subunit [Marinobacter sp.]